MGIKWMDILSYEMHLVELNSVQNFAIHLLFKLSGYRLSMMILIVFLIYLLDCCILPKATQCNCFLTLLAS